jgi:hypothetical protein
MSFFLPLKRPEMPQPAAIYLRMLDLPEHIHIREAEARVEFLMRTHAEVKGGRVVLGTVCKPDVTGRLRDVFTWLLEEMFGPGDGAGSDDPDAARPIDFLVVLDAEYWLDATDRQREILVYHELCHIQPSFDKYGAQRFSRDTGLPVLTLAGHDVEEFSAVVTRYGAHTDELRQFIAAAQEYRGE